MLFSSKTASSPRRILVRRRSLSSEALLASLILVVCVSVGLGFHELGLSDANIIVVFILGILITTAVTRRRACWLTAAVVSITSYDIMFAAPRFTLIFVDPQYIITALLVLGACFIMEKVAEEIRRSLAAEARLQEEKLRVDLLRSISHDLRTPLTGISGNASLLLSDGQHMSDEQRETLYQNLCYNSEWMISMVENILFLTRLDNKGPALELRPELLSEIVEEGMLRLCSERAQHSISVDISDELLFVGADADLLVQVVINLINNAIQHTPSGSHIAVRVFREGDQAIMEVADDGPGVADADRERIFEMFVSASGGQIEGRKGMGIGLSLSRSIIRAHGGELYLRDNQPCGAVFGFSLPLEKDMDEKDLDNESEAAL